MIDRRPRIRPVMINGCEAVVAFDLVTGIYRGELPGLNGQTDCYATDEEQVLVDGQYSLASYLERRTRRIASRDGA